MNAAASAANRFAEPTADRLAADRLIVALDFPDRATALALVDLLPHEVLWYKVGLELYLAEGAPIIHELRARGKRIFLDLKLHDIPNTVAAAVRIAARTGADLLTLHASGGPTMIRAAIEAAHATDQPLALLAVTVLTSMNAAELAAAGVPTTPADQVAHLAAMALDAGAAGLICSPLEVATLRAQHGPAPILVVPGIRATTDALGDQQRTASAADTIRAGASRIVVGRPITQATDPARAAADLLHQITAALAPGDA